MSMLERSTFAPKSFVDRTLRLCMSCNGNFRRDDRHTATNTDVAAARQPFWRAKIIAQASQAAATQLDRAIRRSIGIGAATERVQLGTVDMVGEGRKVW